MSQTDDKVFDVLVIGAGAGGMAAAAPKPVEPRSA